MKKPNTPPTPETPSKEIVVAKFNLIQAVLVALISVAGTLLVAWLKPEKTASPVPEPPVAAHISRGEALYRTGAGIYVAYYWVNRGEKPAAGAKNGFDRAHGILESVVGYAETAGIPDARGKAEGALKRISEQNKDAALNALGRLSEVYVTAIQSAK